MKKSDTIILMNLEYIKSNVEKVKQYALEEQDFEQAHAKEDKILREVLRAIACGIKNPEVLAEEVLKTYDIEFPRWCA